MDGVDNIGLREGVWLVDLAAERAPAGVVLVHLGQVLAPAQVRALAPGRWRIAAEVPARALGDGLTTLHLVVPAGAGADGTRLASLPLRAGSALEGDVAIEIATLRAELDLVKAELRKLGAQVAGR